MVYLLLDDEWIDLSKLLPREFPENHYLYVFKCRIKLQKLQQIVERIIQSVFTER